ncbi:hypothetical protein [Spirochaeta cellobiosiphila]|uniref:hypothetical protein n=1 Tax=Spirochaeta cellobiosiphila TaxID=504483 RepID=UPI00048EDF7E|nr:hypothetical protein [Spirochaeta cellobiosiphila]
MLTNYLWIKGFRTRESINGFIKDEIRFWKGFDMKVELLSELSIRVAWDGKRMDHSLLSYLKDNYPELVWVNHLRVGSLIKVSQSVDDGKSEVLSIARHRERLQEDKVLEILYETY